MTEATKLKDMTVYEKRDLQEEINKGGSLFFNLALYEHAWRVAQMFAQSDMTPKDFRNKPGDCLIAMNYAHRTNSDPFMVLQNLYIVHGKPGIEAKLAIALLNSRFS